MVFLNFFFYFFGILYYASGRMQRKFLLSLFRCIFQPILAWKEAITGFFNFLKIFAIFLEFSITRWVGTKRNDNFYFLYFSAFSDLFWLEMKPQSYFFYFLNLFAFFLKFSITRRVGTQRNDNFYFLSSSAFSNLFRLEMKP